MIIPLSILFMFKKPIFKPDLIAAKVPNPPPWIGNCLMELMSGRIHGLVSTRKLVRRSKPDS